MDKLFIHGNVGREPEMRYLSEGTPVTNFSVAVNRRWKSQDGERQEMTVWYNVAAWRGLAEVIDEWVHKGDSIVMECRLKPDPETGGPRVWEGRDGEPRASYEVELLDFDFGEKGNGGNDGGGSDNTSYSEPDPAGEEEIPF